MKLIIKIIWSLTITIHLKKYKNKILNNYMIEENGAGILDG